MRRRTFVTSCGVTALAGCFGSESEDPDDNEPGGDPADNESTDGGAGNGSDDGTENGGDDGNDLGATDPEPIEYSGTGNATTDPFESQLGLTMLRIDPITNITVDVVDATGSVWRSLDWDLRNYQGLVPIDVPPGEYTLDVQTSVDWTIQVIQPEVGEGDLVTPPATISGSEPRYLGPIEFSEVGSTAIDHAGVGELSLKLYSLGGEYLHELHNQQGIFEADVTVNYGGQGWLVIASQSDWEVALETDEGETEPATTGDSDGGNDTSGGGNASS